MVHGTCVAVGEQGVLLCGAPGSGKSDLALRLIDQPGLGLRHDLIETKLVADDQVVVRRQAGRLLAVAPAELTGLLEIRGLGIVPCPVADEVELHLALQLDCAEAAERMPDHDKLSMPLLGITLPMMKLNPFNASAPAWVRAAVS